MANKSVSNVTNSALGVEIVIPLYSTIFVLAVIGNTLVIVTLLKNRRMRTVTNIFLLNLAFADLLLGVFCMPFTLVGQILQNFVFGQLMCNLIPFFQASSVSSSVWTLVAISLERYFAICKPLRSRSWQTKSHAYRSILAIWLGSFFICLPIGLLARLQPLSGSGRHKCREVWPSPIIEKSYNLLLLILLLVIPLILMGVAYSFIAYQLKLAMQLNVNGPLKDSDVKIRVTTCGESGNSEERRELEKKYCAKHLGTLRDLAETNNSSISENSKCFPGHVRSCPSYCCPKNQTSSVHHGRSSISELQASERGRGKPSFRSSVRSTYSDRSVTAKKKVIIMLCAIVIEFFVCWTPLSIINAWVVFDAEGLYRSLSPTWISLIQLAAYLSSCCNPVTYGFLNLQFRTGFLNVFGCSGGKDGRNRSMPLHPPLFVMSPIEKRRRKKQWLCLKKLYSCGSSNSSSSSEV